MKENVFIIHQSEIIRKGLALILQDYFKMEITQLNSAKDLNSFSGISNCIMIIIADANDDLNVRAIDLLKKSNDVYLIGFYNHTTNSTNNGSFDYQLNEFSSSLQIQKMVQVIRKAGTKTRPNQNENGELTTREKEVIKLIALGFANKEIADKLFISIHTVISHRKNITEKLGIKSISGLTVYAIMNNLLDLENINPEELI